MAKLSIPSSTGMPEQQFFNGVYVNKDLSKGPYLIDGVDTMLKLFAKRCRDLSGQTAHREKKLGIWKSFTWGDYWEHARLIGLGLRSLGLKRGDSVSILSEDRKEWMYADVGAQCMGCIVSGVYTTDSASQLSYLVNDSKSRFLFLENDEQLDKYLSVKDQMPGLVKAIVFEDDGLHGFSDDDVIFLDELYALGRNYLSEHPNLFEEEIEKTKPEDISMLIYTSGTTGMPKGAMYTHQNLVVGTTLFHLSIPCDKREERVCFLPLSHVVERSWSVFIPMMNEAVVNFAESPETVFDNMREIAPKRMFGVPRVWEKLYSSISILNKESTAFGQLMYGLAQRAGLKRADALIEGKRLGVLDWLSYKFWDYVVLGNIRRMLGLHNVKTAFSGAAPISPEILRWFLSLGLPIYEGYGMTETTGLMSINTDAQLKLGSVGQKVTGTEIRISDEGEIQTRGSHIFAGYWNKPDKTAETFTKDGWLRTGDVGELDSHGFLKITGRMKDIIITAGGKNITPSEIENRMKVSPYILDAVVIGDKRKYLTVLVMIEQDNVEKFAQDSRVPFSDFQSLCAAEEVKGLIKDVVDDVNKYFARVEQIKDFRIIDVVLTAEDDELTSTMKLKRSFVEKKYDALISSMY